MSGFFTDKTGYISNQLRKISLVKLLEFDLI